MRMVDSTSGGSTLYLHIGLYSGIYLRTVLDEVTGELSDTRTRFLGLKPVKLFTVSLKGQTAVLALSSKCWLGYADVQTKTFMLTPLDYIPIEWGWNFSSEQCVEGIVGIEEQNLRIFTIERLDNNLIQEIVPLAYTPRRFVKHPDYPLFYVIESDSNILAPATREKLLNDAAEHAADGEPVGELPPPEDFGYPKGTGHWASCIQIVDPITTKSAIYRIELEDNEAAVSIAAVPFTSQDDETFLVVGTGKNMVANPRSFSAGYIHVYRFQEEGKELEFIHKTKIEEPPNA
ncbi:hypothetical protein KEM56_004942, partial [Ascosphaera pollenicola]